MKDPNVEQQAVPGTLDAITARILHQARLADDVGHNLHNHANRVHGSIPAADNGEAPDMPAAAIDRIYAALDRLDWVITYMADGAARNTTLA